ncbi:MAG: hypothetical protein E7559_01275 [Ruminococcaceae bacterium]|nr:hypothetical protein [Oscillospiraceae bacterium]
MHNNSKSLRIIFGFLFFLTIGAIVRYCLPIGIQQHELLRITLRELHISPSDCCVYVGDDLTATYTMVPLTAVSGVSWSDADDGVVSVSGDGVITALSAGSSSVTLTGDGGVAATVKITALRKPLPPGSDLPQLYYEQLPIANVSNPLPFDYLPELVTIPSKYPANRSGMQVTPETLAAYERLYKDATAATGQQLYVLSAFRSFAKQQSLFDEDVAAYRARGYSEEEARRITAQSTQIPGCSEHQLGLTLDVGHTYAVNNTFASSAIGRWITQNAHHYGFILRYPADKVDKTGIDYESWHFRYVGEAHAKYIYEHHLCLEEYIELQAQAKQAAEEYALAVPAGSILA